MSYTKNIWVDQDVTRPRTYEVTTNLDSTITLTDSFGTVTELGTPVNATNMNHIEQGIYDNDAAITTINTAISTINGKIPSNATSSNKLVPVSDVDGAWQNVTGSNINLTSVTAVGTYDIDLSSILPSDANDYECLCRYNFERRDNSSEDTGIKILSSDGTKTWVWEHVEGDPQLSTNYVRKSGQFIAIVGSSRKLKIDINTKPLNNNSIDLIMYRKCGA